MPAPPTARRAISSGRVLIIAHRGNSRAAPENTLPAFSGAVALGVDGVELDYQYSADGVPLVFHDETLDRTTNVCDLWREREMPIAARTLGELRQLDAGAWFDRKFSGARIPTLGEALNVIQLGAMGVLERKAGDAAATVDLLKAKDLIERVVVQAFDWEFLKVCHRLAPSLALVALGEKNLSADALREAVALGACGIGWEDAATNQDLIERAHARGLKVWVWTCDDLERMRQLIVMGVDGLITNIPKAALELRASMEAGAGSQAPRPNDP